MEFQDATPLVPFDIVEYLLIFILQILGVGFHVGQKVVALNSKLPDAPGVIMKTFWRNDWPTIFVSSLILVLDIVGHFTMWYVGVDPFQEGWWKVLPFALALFLGYAGQRVIYKIFGTTEKVFDKQLNDFETKHG